MKLTKKNMLLLFGLALFLISLSIGVYKHSELERYYFPKVAKISDAGTTDLSDKAIQIDESFVFYGEEHDAREGSTSFAEKPMYISEDFSSHLPIIVIDTNGITPKKGTTWDLDKGYAVPIVDDPFVDGSIHIIDNNDGINSLNDDFSAESDMRIRVRGNSSNSYDKKQWLIKLKNDGKKNRENLLGMGNDDEWILNISFVDKSLLRNHLAYQVANQIMGYAPETKYCEVVWKNGDQYEYHGVYLLMQSIKVSDDRVKLPEYHENNKNIPALMRRDRFSDTDIILNNYGTVNGLTDSFIGIEYPEKNVISQESINKITRNIDEFEKALFADSYEEFVKYRKYVDMDSFADYFILNELFMNYDAGYHSTYFYTDYSGVIHMGPVWDFDQMIDNASFHVADVYTTAFHDAPWFKQMLKDPKFTSLICERYKTLRKSILSDKAIADYVNDVTAYLGSAIDRDWARWGYYYADVDSLVGVNYAGQDRNTITHEGEVERMLTTLSAHAAWMDENLDSLYQFKMISLEDAIAYDNSQTKDYRPVLAVVFVFIFLLSINLVQRYEAER